MGLQLAELALEAGTRRSAVEPSKRVCEVRIARGSPLPKLMAPWALDSLYLRGAKR
jgi:hypothetical protein